MKKNSLYPLLAALTILLAACGSSGGTATKSPSTDSSKVSTSTQSSTIEDKQLYDKKIDGKNVSYYVMTPDPIFNSTSVLIEKDGKGLVVDTQFSKDDADNIVQVAKDNKIEVETIYISHSDPDYYFGTAVIKAAFPNAKVLATPSTIDRIKNTYESKLETWADTLKDNAPKEIIIPDPVENELIFADETYKIVGNDPKKTTLYNADDSLLFGGILISTDSHLFLADTKTVESQEQWIASLDELEKLQAKTVIPGHFGNGNDFSPENITFTKHYIEKFIEVEKESKTSADIITKMKAAYPNLPDGSLELSAKVVTNEQPWE